MGKRSFAFILLAIGAATAAAAEPRQPTTRWVVNYDDAQCVATRNYGTEDKPLYLALKPSPTASVMRVMLIRNGPASEAEQRPALIRFDDGRAIGTNALSYGDRRAGTYMASINLPMATFAANRKAAAIEFRGGSFNEQLATPGLDGVMAAFQDCLASLRNVWNIGEGASRVVRPARSKRPLRDLFRSADYPLQSIRERNTGTVGISMLIDETGKVRDCMVEETSGYATLDTMSCYVITSEAKFEPATGADGKPVKSANFERISWRIRA